MPLETIDCIITITEALWHLGRIDESLEMIAKGEEILSTVVKDLSSAITSRKATLITFKGKIYLAKGDFKHALSFFQQGLALREKYNNKNELADSFINIGLFYRFKGDWERALKYFQKSLSNLDKGKNKQDFARSLNYIGTIYHHKGNWEQALEYYNQSLILRNEIGNKQDIAKSFHNIGLTYLVLGDFDYALNYAQQSLVLHKEIGNKQDIAKALSQIGNIYRGKGELDRALKYYQKGLATLENYYNRTYAGFLLNIANIYREKGLQNKALDYAQQSLSLFEELDDKKGIAYSLNNIGRTYQNCGDLKHALKYYQNSLPYFEKLSNIRDIAGIMHNLGCIYREQGNLEEALDYYHRSLNLREKIGNKLDIGISYQLIGVTHHQKGELDQAIEYLEQSIVFLNEVGNNIFRAACLLTLIYLTIDRSEFKRAQKYFQQLKGINESEKNKLIHLYYRMAKASLLKSDNNLPSPFNLAVITTILRNLVQSQEIFHQIIQEEIIDYEVSIDAIFNLCEILLFEMKLLGTKEPLIEVNSLTKQLFRISETQNLYSLRAKVLLLQSRLALIDLDLEKAQRLLIQAKQIAEQKGLQPLAIVIIREQKQLSSQFGEWGELSSQDSSIFERLEQTRLEELIILMRQKRVETISHYSTLKPLKSEEFASYMLELFKKAQI